ncbi:MAG: response regulator [Gallionella sp.]|nr:response regulator [Gallionella sp.]
MAILAVDDTQASLKLLAEILKAEGYEVRAAISGELALRAAMANPPELVLLDIRMPVMDGYEVCRRLKAEPATRDVPVIFLSAASETVDKVQGFGVGCVDYVTKPYQREELLARVRTHLELNRLRHHLEALVEKRTHELIASHRETIVTMTRAASYKDEETGAHVARVSFYSVELAQALGMDAEFCDIIHYASPMHDVGKIAIPDAILGKPGKFEPHEWEIMKTHAALGAKMLGGSDSPYLVMGAEIAGGHHERWDGGGYPLGIRGEAIPLSARIMQICDVYDALRSRRPYKEAFSHERSTEIILAGDGRTQPSHFDPAILESFGGLAGRFCDIFEAHKEDG